MPHPDWNASYATGEKPWDTGHPSIHLVEMVEAGTIPAGRALEVGCGTGSNALWLAAHEFEVVAVDLSPLAIEEARGKAAAAGVGAQRCRFEVVDFLAAEPTGGPFSFVFDRGCFHVFDEPEVRARFAARVAALLGPGGMWLSLIGSTEGPARDFGPPRRTARDVMDAIEPSLELVGFRAVEFEPSLDTGMPAWPAWLCLSRQRQVPAQPSTRR